MAGGEKLFETRVKKWLHNQGIYAAGTGSDKLTVPPRGWFFKVWGGGYGISGIPDLILCVNGVFMAVELKTERGKPTELQRLNTARINESGGVGVILYPAGFGTFRMIIEGVLACDGAIQGLKLLKNAFTTTDCVILTD